MPKNPVSEINAKYLKLNFFNFLSGKLKPNNRDNNSSGKNILGFVFKSSNPVTKAANSVQTTGDRYFLQTDGNTVSITNAGSAAANF